MKGIVNATGRIVTVHQEAAFPEYHYTFLPDYDIDQLDLPEPRVGIEYIVDPDVYEKLKNNRADVYTWIPSECFHVDKATVACHRLVKLP